MFTVQDGPGPGCEEDREAPRKADETHGVQGDTQWFHGDRLNCSRRTDPLEYLELSSVDTMVVERTVPSECHVESGRWVVVESECCEFDVAAYTDLILPEM